MPHLGDLTGDVIESHPLRLLERLDNQKHRAERSPISFLTWVVGQASGHNREEQNEHGILVS